MPSTSDHEDSGDDLGLGDLIPEPESPVPPPFSFSTYTPPSGYPLILPDGRAQLIIRLVGSHPLWGHHLWNTARTLSDYLLRHPSLTRHKRILELGAGAGLPSIVASLDGAAEVVITDYPDTALVDNISWNVETNLPDSFQNSVRVKGYVWGQSTDGLGQDHDLLLLSDLVFNHSQHRALAHSVDRLLSKSHGASILVFFTHHRPKYAAADMAFFDTLCEAGWEYERVVEEWTGPMFAEDPGDEKVRGTVHGFKAWRSKSS